MSIEKAIVAILKASPTFSTLCAGRIWALILPETAAFPAITYQRISETPDYTLDGPGTFGEARLQIDCWSAASHSEASQIADAIASAIDGYTGTSAGVSIHNVMRDNSQDFYEPNPKCYRRSVDYMIQFAL